MRDPRGFPLLGLDRFTPREGGPLVGPRFIPWDVIDEHAEQAQRNHMQTVDRLAERGGLGPSELTAVLEDRRWDRDKRGTGTRPVEQKHLDRVVDLLRSPRPPEGEEG